MKTFYFTFLILRSHLLLGSGLSFFHFGQVSTKYSLKRRKELCLYSASATSTVSFDESQWDHFVEVMTGKWRGRWATYDSEGIVLRQAMNAGVDLIVNGKEAEHSLRIDGSTTRVGQYHVGKIGKHVLAGSGAVVGPSSLRSGIMSTELVIRHKSARLRATIQHAPAVAPNDDGLEQAFALKVYRVTLAREILKSDINDSDEEMWFSVDPFAWRRTWNGTTFLATPTSGPAILDTQYNAADTHWHNVRTADADYTLAQGNVLLQVPTIFPAGQGLKPLRLAWMPESNLLLRAEAMILALDSDGESDVDDSNLHFLPPRLLAFQVDELTADLCKEEDDNTITKEEEENQGGGASSKSATDK